MIIVYIVFSILNGIFLFGLIKQKKTVAGISGAIVEALLLCGIALKLLNISLTPFAFCVFAVVLALWCIFAVFTLLLKRIKAIPIVASVLFAVFAVAVVYFAPAYAKEQTEDCDYMALYDKATGVSETNVDFHRLYNGLFMADRASFVGGYGVLSCGWRDVLDNTPVSVKRVNAVPEELKTPAEANRHFKISLPEDAEIVDSVACETEAANRDFCYGLLAKIPESTADEYIRSLEKDCTSETDREELEMYRKTDIFALNGEKSDSDSDSDSTAHNDFADTIEKIGLSADDLIGVYTKYYTDYADVPGKGEVMVRSSDVAYVFRSNNEVYVLISG